MIIVMRNQATASEIDGVVTRLAEIGCEAHVSAGQFRTVIGAIGETGSDPDAALGGNARGRAGRTSPQVVPLCLPRLPTRGHRDRRRAE